MSTRSVILITGNSRYGSEKETVRLYKHSDGYPTGNLSVIAEALEQVNKQIKHANSDRPSFLSKMTIRVSQVAGKIIGAATNEYGMGAELECSFSEQLKPKHFGDQWDVEWMYVIDLDKKIVSIYRGNFKSGIQAGYKNGTVDPLSYVDQLTEKYQNEERLKITKLMKQVEATGFKIAKPGMKPKAFKVPNAKGTGRPDIVVYAAK